MGAGISLRGYVSPGGLHLDFITILSLHYVLDSFTCLFSSSMMPLCPVVCRRRESYILLLLSAGRRKERICVGIIFPSLARTMLVKRRSYQFLNRCSVFSMAPPCSACAKLALFHLSIREIMGESSKYAVASIIFKFMLHRASC